MAGQKINIVINEDASIEYGVEGIKGKSCADVTKFIDKLSKGIVSSEKTGEFCQAPEREVARQKN
jgi:hypothetical protein